LRNTYAESSYHMAAIARRSLPYPFGATLIEAGVDMAVYSKSADLIEFCSFDESGAETRTPSAPPGSGSYARALRTVS
jgi:pullulanase/glycogen debranching enzyme